MPTAKPPVVGQIRPMRGRTKKQSTFIQNVIGRRKCEAVSPHITRGMRLREITLRQKTRLRFNVMPSRSNGTFVTPPG
jgi:hypothetical protein